LGQKGKGREQKVVSGGRKNEQKTLTPYNREVLDEPLLDLLEPKVVCIQLRTGICKEGLVTN